MGRTQPSLGLAPPAQRKDARAKAARLTAHKTIPALLASSSRARKGVEGSTLIVDSPFSDSGVTSKKESRKTSRNSGDDQGNNKVKVRIVVDDTLAVARAMSHQSAEAGTDTAEGGKPSSSRPKRNVAVLNMASPLLPGGGFLNGATAQEETLCNRTTLYPALRDEFYRLPEVGAIWTEDVMVFRDESGKDLNKGERWWIDVISAGMLRFPDVEEAEEEEAEEEEGEEHEEQKKYANPKDRTTAIERIRCVMEILGSKGVEKCVLGAWGCGAYGNPVPEIARAFKKVIWGGEVKGGRKSGKGVVCWGEEVKGGRKTGKGGDCWGGLREVAFAIKEGKTASEFAKHFGVEVALEKRPTPGEQEETNEADERAAETIRDLEDKIRELDLRINLSKNPALKAPLETIRADLRSQLALKQSSATANSDNLDEKDDESQSEDDTKSEWD
ncbi:hypothetical protein LTR20_006598 [Exophiala xenobiotica]|nr:hypothetical protein LTS13_008104 [Exophiala xenobiotica]KAK5394960.1 hypothetical protein LTR79_007576 [Exophiala xenobiotica]KAK5413040.1 hypothetical protein LTR90_007162 [Exophiala xenobiotica]KAK5461674.1 hypothetical protein LTR20_006598 [Exophiala xenobiotica]KAK5482358.1 hypothetical protein LTR26_006692 [Exophiala xenobiotica]